jgi:hypothetical protein
MTKHLKNYETMKGGSHVKIKMLKKRNDFFGGNIHQEPDRTPPTVVAVCRWIFYSVILNETANNYYN